MSRYQTQPCNAPPACVQNAMMTKDKKPFTYTPGGIDLSEIRSPRMAKRIARNAQYEGVSGPPKPSPLATNSNSGPPPPPPMMPTGMPVQVFPTGPPTPPSAPHPPPPPPQKAQLAPSQPSKASSPQNFEPPPMGCRPEIKIPPNPMATLRKVPPPRPKDDFWVEEYRKEKSKSPSMVCENGDSYSQSQTNGNAQVGVNEPRFAHDDNNQRTIPREDTQQRPLESYNTGQRQQPPQPQQSIEQRQYQQQYQKPYQQQSSVQQRRSPSPIRNTVAQRLEQKRTDSPFQTDDHPNLQRPLSPIKLNQGQPREIPTNNSQTINRTIQSDVSQQTQSPHAKHVGTGSLYIPPVAPENLAVNKQKQQQQSEKASVNSPQAVQTPSRDIPEKLPWMSQKQSKEVPEWIREEENNSPVQAVKTQPTNYTPVPSAKTQLPPQNREWTRDEPHYSPVASTKPQPPQNQFNFQPKSIPNTGNVTGSERIIPIQFEPQSPHSRTSSSANTVPEQNYSSPTYTPPGYINRNPNQFVDQGYNNYPQQWQSQNRDDTHTPTQSQNQPQPYNWRTQNRVTSPPSQQQQFQQRPIQNRVASPPVQTQVAPQNWPSPPVQQSPPMTGVTRIIPIQVEGQESPFNPPVRGPIMQSPTVIQNDPRTLHHQNSWGGSTPNQSKSFKILQKITDTDLKEEDPSERMKRMHLNEQEHSRGRNQVPTSKAPAQRYVQPGMAYAYEDIQRPYIHPSEQQAPEPKIYAGSAIPSRSFKMLQAMTTPENAGPGQSDL